MATLTTSTDTQDGITVVRRPGGWMLGWTFYAPALNTWSATRYVDAQGNVDPCGQQQHADAPTEADAIAWVSGQASTVQGA